MNAQSHPRIWLALDALERSEAPLGAAVRLAGVLQAELNTLFVESDDLFRMAAFPRSFETRLFGPSLLQEQGYGAEGEHVPGASRVVGRAAKGSVQEALSTLELQNALRAQAAALQRQLDRAASATGVRWKFQIARGRIVQQALERADEGDCVVVPAMALATALAISQPPVARRPRESQRELWAVPGAGHRAHRVLEFAHRLLAGAARGRLLLPEEPELANALRAWLRERGWQDDWREATLADLRRARQAPWGGESGLLLLPRPADAVERERLDGLWRRAGWPIVLV